MMFKLTKPQVTALQKLVDAYDLAKSELSERLDEIASDWESEFGDKSEKWQDGERGQEVQERIDLVRGWFDEIPGDCPIDPEELA